MRKEEEVGVRKGGGTGEGRGKEAGGGRRGETHARIRVGEGLEGRPLPPMHCARHTFTSTSKKLTNTPSHPSPPL
jgi:hypothetical protein